MQEKQKRYRYHMGTQMDHFQSTNTEHNNLRHQYRYVKCIRHNSNKQLIDVAKEILNEDEIRIPTVLLKETTLEIKVESAQTFTFQSTLAHLRETLHNLF